MKVTCETAAHGFQRYIKQTPAHQETPECDWPLPIEDRPNGPTWADGIFAEETPWPELNGGW